MFARHQDSFLVVLFGDLFFRTVLSGDGGEFESAILDAPWMKSKIETQHTVHWTGRRGWVDIWGAELV